MRFYFLNSPVICNTSWDVFFNNPAIKICLLQIENAIINRGCRHTPYSPSDIFKVFNQVDLKNCKVVILGQDPYPQSNVATGRAFEVANIQCWTKLGNNTSLQNILKLLHKNLLNPNRTVQGLTIDVIKNDILNGIFPISPPNVLFNNWQNRGVLLLNTALTCDQGLTANSSGSHLGIWKPFTEEVIKYIDSYNIKNNLSTKIEWFLWGAKVKNFQSLILNTTPSCSKHPCKNLYNSGSFYDANHFFNNTTTVTWY